MTIQRSPLTWPGGKALLYRQIEDLIPAYSVVVDVFGGGAGFILNLPPREHSIEVFNDINDELVNFYLVCQRHPEEILRLWELTPRASSLFNGRSQSDLCTDVERAVNFMATNAFGFNGNSSSFAKSRGSRRPASRLAKIDKLSALSDRLDKVTVLNESVFDLIDFYDSDTTFFFLDPPYLTGDQGLYGAHSTFDHQALSQSIQKIKGKYLLTIDDSVAARAFYLSDVVNHRKLRQSSSLSPTRRAMPQLAIFNY
jgi:DNA adenine methylase